MKSTVEKDEDMGNNSSHGWVVGIPCPEKQGSLHEDVMLTERSQQHLKWNIEYLEYLMKWVVID